MNSFLLLATVFISLIFQGYSDISVIEPVELKTWWNNHPEKTYTSLATFGHIPWGKKIIGNLRLANPLDACNYIKQDEKEYLAHDILVAKRGECTFVTKAHYAQLAGASMLLVLDDKEEDVDLHLMVDNSDEGKNIKIPVALVSKVAGEELLNYLQSTDKKKSSVSAVYEFSIKKAKDPEYHVWLSSSKNQSFAFVRQWTEIEKKLEGYAKFVPHYFHTAASSDPSNCYCGKYCGQDPDGERKNTGRDVIIEDLREMCLLKHYSLQKWFQYMKNYHVICFHEADMSQCGNKALFSAGADIEKINKCVAESFDVFDADRCTTNKYLEDEKRLLVQDKVYLFPSVTINGFTLRGSLIPVNNLLESICEALISTPPICQETFNIVPSVNSSNLWILIGVGFLILILSVLAFYYIRRSLKREMQEKVQKDVSIMIQQYSELKNERGDNLDETL